MVVQKKVVKKKRDKQREPQDEFNQKIVDLARVTRVMAGGKRMRFRVCVAVGNGRGQVGIGIAKGADVTIAVNKAVKQAKKKIINIPLVNDTIPHEMRLKYKAAKLLLKPAPKGTGVKAGGAVRMVLELAGVPNIVAKILGTNNKVSNVKALLIAMQSFKAAPKQAKEDKKKDKKLTAKEETIEKKEKDSTKKN